VKRFGRLHVDLASASPDHVAMNALQPLADEPAGSLEAAVDVRRGARLRTPLVFASPHSGRIYPDALHAASALDAHELRRSEDAFVDELISGALERGAAIVACRYARAYVDVNRDPWELDPAMFEDELPDAARRQSPRVAAGLGAIPRLVAEGREIYSRKLTYSEASERLEAVHRPYHTALGAVLEEARDQFGVAILIDWHSMPSVVARSETRLGRMRPDVVLGDRHGAACGKAITVRVRRAFEAEGYVAAANAPYAGGWTTQTWGRPREGLHALQIELDRGLYLDEERLQRSAGFARLKRDLDRLTETLAAEEWAAKL
jgi:N-formylglutamate amidohydrolase